MLNIALPNDEVRGAAFYLAMEEYVARHVLPSFPPDDSSPNPGGHADCFFLWQVPPSVIFGRNQLIENEVNLDFCRSHHIHAYRRKSGGGCVYADMNNIMLSYVTDDDQVGFTFNRYITMILAMLHRLGIDASATGRNDIMIGNRKVSGNAFYKIQNRSIVHGTMLYDTDMINMVGAITPNSGKLLTKGIVSVRQRVALLKDYTTLTLPELKKHVLTTLCDRQLMLTPDDVDAIRQLEQDYLTPEFIYGKNPPYTIVRRRRIEGVGDLEARITLNRGVIKSVNLMGDYLLVGDLDHGLLAKLVNQPLTREHLWRRLPDRIDDIVMNLMKEDFIQLLTEE